MNDDRRRRSTSLRFVGRTTVLGPLRGMWRARLRFRETSSFEPRVATSTRSSTRAPLRAKKWPLLYFHFPHFGTVFISADRSRKYVIPTRLHFPAVARPPVFTVSAPTITRKRERRRKDGTTTKRRNVRTGGRNLSCVCFGYRCGGSGHRGVSWFV